MSHPESSRTSRPLLARLGVAALGLTVGVGGLTLVAPAASAATIDGLSGTGSAADPIVIDSAADLDAAAAAVNTDYPTFGALSYRLGADIDYAGGTFATFRQFAGTFDGRGHEISDLVLQPGTTVLTDADAGAQTGFVRILANGTITDLTLKRMTAATTTADTVRVQVGGFAGRSSGGTITGSALIDSTVRSADNTENSSAVGGFVGKTVGGTTTLRGNLLQGSTVSGDKRVGGVVGWSNIAATVADTLVAATDVAHHGGSGAGAAFVIGHSACTGTATGNVVVSGTVEQVASANYGWIRSATGAACTSSGNLVNAANNIDPATPVGHTAAPDPNPYDVLWIGSTLLSSTGWTRGDLGTATPAAELRTPATYEALGWDLTPGTGDWRWAVDLGHPVPAHADLDGYDEIGYDLAGGTNGANPSAYTSADADLTLAAPTRAGYTFTGWTGTGLTGPTATVTIPTGSTGDREYVATWAATAYALAVDLAGGTVTQAAPSSYTVESDAITLATPTRAGHAFAGWTGTGIDGTAETVTIAAGSTGDRAYTATWTAGSAISYDLAGGTGAEANPATYVPSDPDITLVNPTRAGYTFAGWTGTGLSGPTQTVTIPSGSTGPRSYAATWSLDPAPIAGVTGDGTAASPYLVGTAADLDAVAAAVNGDVATFGRRHIELTAHIDYDRGTFATFREFSGVLDGRGHEISDLTLRPGTTADAGDAGATQTGFVQVLAGGTITGLTLRRLTSLTAGGTADRVQQGGFAGRSAGGTITASALVDSEVRSADNTDNSSAVGGFVGKSVGTAPTTIHDVLLEHTTVSGDKRVGGITGWQNVATTVADSLVVDTSVAQHGGSGAGAAFVAGHTVCTGTLSGNVVLSGTIAQTGPAGYGWIRSAATGCATSDNLVNAANNIDPTTPVGHTTVPDPNPYAVLWTGTSLLSATGWTKGDLGTSTPAAQLAERATYEALGWDLTSTWTWDADAERPTLQRVAAPVVEPPVITVTTTRTSYGVGSSPTAAEVLTALGAAVDRGTLAIDLGGVDFATPGSYATTVTATDEDEAAEPVVVTIVVSALDGQGTEASPYAVGSVADLDAAVAMVNADEAQAGAATAHYELTADIDYDGGTFATFRRFSGVLDGAGHTISDLTLRPGTVPDPADPSTTTGAGATQTGFVQILGGTIEDLTLRELRSVTAGSADDRIQQGGFAGRAAAGATITGSALLDATVSSASNTDNSSAVGGLVGKSTGAGVTLADNLLAGVAVNGDKRVGGAVGWANTAASVSRTLVLDTSVTQNGSSGAGAAFVSGHSVCTGTLTGNVVLSGAIRQTSPANYGWIRSAATGCEGTGNLVNANNNIDATTPVGHTSTPTPNPYDVFWSGSTTLDTAGGAWTRGDLGSYTSAADLAQQATYEAIGFDFTAGTGAWRWDAERAHPLPSGVTLPTVAVAVDLAGGTDAGANPTTHGYALDATLVAPTRTGYTFAGWTGSGIEGAAPTVALPRYPTGPLAYTATWSPIAYAVAYDLAGGTAGGGNPASYTIETAAFSLAAPTRAGYTFAGWTGTGLAAPATAVVVPAGSTGNRGYAATWTPIGYPVGYDLAGGQASGNPATYTVETATFTLTHPTRSGYTFAGWTGTGLTVPTTTVVVATGSTEARSYVATWTPVVFPIVYELGADEDFSGPVPGTYTIESGAITLPTPVRAGHTFAGWTGTDLTGPTMVVTIAPGSTGTRTYTPTWDRINAIRYVLAGGTVAAGNPTSYTARSAPIRLLDPTRLGYDFAGWSGLGATRPGLVIPTGTTGDLVLVATWTRKAAARAELGLSWAQRTKGRIALRVPTVGGYATPTGAVTVTVTGKVRKKGRSVRVTRTVRTTLRAGTATLTLPRKLPAGRYQVTARYGGDDSYAADSSRALPYRIKK